MGGPFITSAWFLEAGAGQGVILNRDIGEFCELTASLTRTF